jgi:hypothetical protein
MRIITSFDNPLVDELFTSIIHHVVYRSFRDGSEIPVDFTGSAGTMAAVLEEICGAVDVSVVSLADMRHEGDQVMGGCWYTDTADSADAHEWTIGLRGGSSSETLLALVHEAMHLGQYLTGRLRTVKTGDEYCDCENYWLGEDASGLGYSEQPWEDEVYEKQSDWLLDLVQDPEFAALLQRVAAG